MTRASDVAKLITNGGTIVDGNIAFADGHGLDFSATANTSVTNASTSNELLDNYEEGTWTPVYVPESNSFSSISYDSSVFGTYTKVGRKVTLVATLHLASLSVGSASGNLHIEGAPFAPEAAIASYSGSVSQQTGWSTMPTQIMMANDATMFMGHEAASGSYGVIQVSHMNSSSSNRMRFTITYFVS